MTDIGNHNHDGINSVEIEGSNLRGAPQTALTPAVGGTLTSGGANDLKTADATIIANAITRIDQLETKLRNLGFIL